MSRKFGNGIPPSVKVKTEAGELYHKGLGIVCPRCRSTHSQVVDTRPKHNSIRRIRICLECEEHFGTHESIDGLLPDAYLSDYCIEHLQDLVEQLEKMRG